jgi:transposase
LPQAAILFDKFHILRHLGEALDRVRKQEYARLDGKDRKFIKGQKYALLSNRENLRGSARKNLKVLLATNIAAYCKLENKVSLGFVEGLNNKIRVFQRRAYGLRDEEYLRLKVLTCMLPEL